MSTKKELRAEIDRLARMVREQVSARDAAQVAWHRSIHAAEGQKALLILPDGMPTQVVIAGVEFRRDSPFSPFDVSMTVYPQPPKD